MSVVKRDKKKSIFLIIIAIILAVCSMVIPLVKYYGGIAEVNETDSFLLSYDEWKGTISFREGQFFITGIKKICFDILISLGLGIVIRTFKEKNENGKINDSNKKLEKK